jgi:hypothetical protein
MEKEEKEKDPQGLVAEVNRLADLVAYQRGSACLFDISPVNVSIDFGLKFGYGLSGPHSLYPQF